MTRCVCDDQPRLFRTFLLPPLGRRPHLHLDRAVAAGGLSRTAGPHADIPLRPGRHSEAPRDHWRAAHPRPRARTDGKLIEQFESHYPEAQRFSRHRVFDVDAVDS